VFSAPVDENYSGGGCLHPATSIEADMAAADNDEILWQKIDVHHRRIRHAAHFVYARALAASAPGRRH